MALLNTIYGSKHPAFYANQNYKELYANLMHGMSNGFSRISQDLARAQLINHRPSLYTSSSSVNTSPLYTSSPNVNTSTLSPPTVSSAPTSPNSPARTGDQKDAENSTTTRRRNCSPKTNFSIDGILGKKITIQHSDSDDELKEDNDTNDRCSEHETDVLSETSERNKKDEDVDETEFSWLQCTRYKPPKLPRSRKREGIKKRKLGRNPRVPFTQHQVAILEQKFRQTHYLSSVDVLELSAALNLTETRVKIWFQNRRARERRDRECKKNNMHVRPSQASSTTISASLPSYPTGIPWPLPLPPNPAALAQFTQALQYGASAFTPVPFIYAQPPMSSAGPISFFRSPDVKD